MNVLFPEGPILSTVNPTASAHGLFIEEMNGAEENKIPRSVLMTKKIVKLTESEDVKDAAAAKQPPRRSRKSGTVVENTVSPEGIELANVTTEPLNAEPAEGAVPMAFVPAVISTVGEVASPKGPSGEEVPAETVKVPKAAN